MGKTIIYDDSLGLVVTGIVKDWNKNTDFNFRDFISYSTIQNSFLKDQGNWNNWGGWNSATQVFAKINGQSTPGQINAQLTKLVIEHMKLQPDEQAKILLQPLSDIHFNGDFKDAYSRQAHLPRFMD